MWKNTQASEQHEQNLEYHATVRGVRENSNLLFMQDPQFLTLKVMPNIGNIAQPKTGLE